MSSGSPLYEWDQGHVQHMPVLGEHRVTSFEKGEVFFLINGAFIFISVFPKFGPLEFPQQEHSGTRHGHT